jgi:hypothetical protein
MKEHEADLVRHRKIGLNGEANLLNSANRHRFV